MLGVKKAVLRNFNAGANTATIELVGSGRAYLEEVMVAHSVPSVEMIAGRMVAVVFFDEHNAKDAVIVAVYDWVLCFPLPLYKRGTKRDFTSETLLNGRTRIFILPRGVYPLTSFLMA
jgi:hypothetical protein